MVDPSTRVPDLLSGLQVMDEDFLDALTGDVLPMHVILLGAQEGRRPPPPFSPSKG